MASISSNASEGDDVAWSGPSMEELEEEARLEAMWTARGEEEDTYEDNSENERSDSDDDASPPPREAQVTDSVVIEVSPTNSSTGLAKTKAPSHSHSNSNSNSKAVGGGGERTPLSPMPTQPQPRTGSTVPANKPGWNDVGGDATNEATKLATAIATAATTPADLPAHLKADAYADRQWSSPRTAEGYSEAVVVACTGGHGHGQEPTVGAGSNGARALSLLEDMRAKGHEPSVRALDATIKCCEEGGLVEEALRLVQDLKVIGDKACEHAAGSAEVSSILVAPVELSKPTADDEGGVGGEAEEEEEGGGEEKDGASVSVRIYEQDGSSDDDEEGPEIEDADGIEGGDDGNHDMDTTDWDNDVRLVHSMLEASRDEARDDVLKALEYLPPGSAMHNSLLQLLQSEEDGGEADEGELDETDLKIKEMAAALASSMVGHDVTEALPPPPNPRAEPSDATGVAPPPPPQQQPSSLSLPRSTRKPTSREREREVASELFSRAAEASDQAAKAASPRRASRGGGGGSGGESGRDGSDGGVDGGLEFGGEGYSAWQSLDDEFESVTSGGLLIDRVELVGDGWDTEPLGGSISSSRPYTPGARGGGSRVGSSNGGDEWSQTACEGMDALEAKMDIVAQSAERFGVGRLRASASPNRSSRIANSDGAGGDDEMPNGRHTITTALRTGGENQTQTLSFHSSSLASASQVMAANMGLDPMKEWEPSGHAPGRSSSGGGGRGEGSGGGGGGGGSGGSSLQNATDLMMANLGVGGEGRGGGHGSGSRSGSRSGSGSGSGARPRVEIVRTAEASSTSSGVVGGVGEAECTAADFTEGEYDEEEAARAFQEAVMAWRKS